MNGEELKPESARELLVIKEGARILKVSPRTVWRMIADGQLTAVRFRRCTRLLRAQVLGFVNGGNGVEL